MAMREREVKRRLRALQAPGGGRARLQTIELARAELAGVERAPDGAAEARPRRGRRWLPPALGAIALVGFSLWAPTHGLAERIGELVGIGDPPTEKPVFETSRNKADAIVIGVGRTSSGLAWEAIAARYRQDDTGLADAPLCVRLSFPGHDSHGTLQCLTRASMRVYNPGYTRPTAFPGPVELGPQEQLVVAGIVGKGVASVSVDASGVRTEAEVLPLTPELGAQLGTNLDAGYFVAFVPPSRPSQSPPRVTSFDEGGRPLFRRFVEVVVFPHE